MSDDAFSISGLSETLANIAGFAPELRGRAAKALNTLAELTMTDSKEHTPVQYGVLKRSGNVSKHATAADLSATLSYGTDYGVFVHENLTARHPIGEAKFLEHAVQRRAATFADDISKGLGL